MCERKQGSTDSGGSLYTHMCMYVYVYIYVNIYIKFIYKISIPGSSQIVRLGSESSYFVKGPNKQFEVKN